MTSAIMKAEAPRSRALKLIIYPLPVKVKQEKGKKSGKNKTKILLKTVQKSESGKKTKKFIRNLNILLPFAANETKSKQNTVGWRTHI